MSTTTVKRIGPTVPIVTRSATKKGKITLNGKVYRAPSSIPVEAWQKIQSRIGAKSSSSLRQTYFYDLFSDNDLEKIILDAAIKPRKFYLERKSTKIIYRAQEFKEPIGYDPIREKDCHWLLVVAKSNSWIISAYPVSSEPGADAQ